MHQWCMGARYGSQNACIDNQATEGNLMNLHAAFLEHPKGHSWGLA